LGAILIGGELEPALLQQAVQQLVDRHEILHTTFSRPRGIKTPFQVVAEASLFSWAAVDLSSLETAEQNERIEATFTGEGELRFDFERGPLLRVTLIKQSAERHVLLVSLAALCGDSRTLVNITAELSRAYAASLNQQELAGVPMQYADFAEWANELLEANDEPATAGKAHWQNRRAAGVPGVAIPFARRAAGPGTFQLESVSVEIDAPFSEIEGLARSSETSVSAVLFACWQALVWRLAGQTESEFVLYHGCAGRKFEDLQNALGPYAKYLPIACRCEDESFLAHLRRVSDALDAADEWQEYFDPGAAANAAGDSVAFEFEEQPRGFPAGLVSFSLIRQQVCCSPFKLKLSCLRSGEALTVELHYNARVLHSEAANQIAGYFQRLLSGVLQHTEADPGAIEILSADERRRLLVDLNETTARFPQSECVHQLFEAQAESTPAALAVVSGDQELTYELLNARANQLAHLLRRRGVGPDVCVGLCVERSVEMIVGLLGILKAGGAYVPLNPDHPTERLASQLAESRATILVTNNDPLDQSFGFGGETIDLARDLALLEAEPKTNPASITRTENLVYVIYTSGSTGTPKGVAVRHHNLANYTQFILQRLEIDGPLNFATVSTISADLGNTCIFPALVSGGCLHILDYDTGLEGDLFRDYIARRPIDVLKIVPSHFSALLATQPDGKILPAKYLILGGEALSWDLVQRLSQIDHACQIINHYGPTETTVGSLTFSVDEKDVSRYSSTVPIGRPIANTRLYILDRRLRPVPVGVTGELYIGGAGVTAGYLNQPTETAVRFVPDPFCDDSDLRLYRTGDLARYLPDGIVEFLGRADTQVKVRGYRVELGEIEAVLSAYDGVRQAIVVAQGETGTVDVPSARISGGVSSADERLVAYLVTSGAEPPSPDDLRASLKKRLPEYMVPAAFVFLQTLPLTPNGKVDRAALPAPDDARPGLQSNFVAPRTPVEKQLAAIWASLLKVSAVGVDDNFFDLGGHSLLATQVVSRMRKEFQLEIPLRSLFESPTVAQLAEKIEGADSSDAERFLAEIEELSEEDARQLLEQEGTTAG
jgi:amino acid adenylation domain-containing protein